MNAIQQILLWRYCWVTWWTWMEMIWNWPGLLLQTPVIWKWL